MRKRLVLGTAVILVLLFGATTLGKKTSVSTHIQPATSVATSSSIPISDTATCFGLTQSIYSPDDTNKVYVGRAVMRVNPQDNKIEYVVLADNKVAPDDITLKLPSNAVPIHLSTKKDTAAVFQGTVAYQESDEQNILYGDMRANYFTFPIKSTSGKNVYAYFGNNFTPVSCNDQLIAAPKTIRPHYSSPIIWEATHETGTADEWRLNENTDPAQDSNYCARPLNGVTDEVAHSGKYSLKMTIDTTVDHAGCRTFRYPEAATGKTYYYSAWFYLPEQYVVYGKDPNGIKVSGWTNLMQFKARSYDQTGGSDVFWSVGISNREDGTMYLLTKWDKNQGVKGPNVLYSLLPPSDRQFHQDKVNIYPQKWFHLEARIQQSTFHNYDGRVTVWQDGTQIFDMDHVITRQPFSDHNKPSKQSWSVNAYGGVVDGLKEDYSKSLYPRDYTVYVDDAAISTERLEPEFKHSN